MTKKILIVALLALIGLGLGGCNHMYPRYAGTISYGWHDDYYDHSGYGRHSGHHEHHHHDHHW